MARLASAKRKKATLKNHIINIVLNLKNIEVRADKINL